MRVPLADLSALKRVLFEAHTLVVANLKEQITSLDAALHKKVPANERDSRMKAVRADLTGLVIEGPSEPAQALLDACAQMAAADEPRYIPPERCVSRVHEVAHYKQPSKQVELEAEKLVIKEKHNVPDEQAHSALQVKEALQRRGVGLVFAEIVTYASYSKYLTNLFAHMHREPPPGYSRCALGQIIAADKRVWTQLVEDGVKVKRDSSTATFPLDTKLTEALENYTISSIALSHQEGTPS